jgi:(p)ppGpp synthase/HD superfamily hydrolase
LIRRGCNEIAGTAHRPREGKDVKMPEHTNPDRVPLFDAIEFAVKAHRGQLRKGTTIPYVSHPMEVARILLQAGCSDTIAIAGLLHDTVEDAGVTVE